MTRPYLAIAVSIVAGVILSTSQAAPDQAFLLRHVPSIKPQADDLTRDTETATYKPVFGKGDAKADLLHGIVRFGQLTVEAPGASSLVNYPTEEQIYYVTSGRGEIVYGAEKREIKTDDFLYLPSGVRHGVVNRSVNPIHILVMGFSLPPSVGNESGRALELANAGNVEPITLASHGPTTTYKLLMGTTKSTRDRLAAAHQMVSLFVMEFLPTGTNNPHKHDSEEEIYFVLRGHGTMVAGLDEWGNGARHPCHAGDAFYFAAGTTLGFYNGGKEGEDNPLILAVRSTDPAARKK